MAAAWKEHEDILLMEGIKKYGMRRWDKISASLLLSRRSDVECEERFRSLMEPKIWSSEDDRKLYDLAQIHKPLWTTIGALMGRNGNNCYRRYLSLDPLAFEKKVQTGCMNKSKLKRKVAQIKEIPAALGDKSKMKKQKGGMKRKLQLED